MIRLPLHRLRPQLPLTLPILAAATAVAVWWLAVAAFDIAPLFLPSPAAVASAFATAPGPLLRETGATAAVTLAGFALAGISAVVLGAVLAACRTVERAVLPLLIGGNAIPKVSLAPLLVVWLGFGPQPRIVMVAAICFFPILLSTMAGLRTPTELAELARSLTASRWRTFTKIRFPWALPQIFTGLKTAITLAVIGAVVAEIASPNAGLGAVIVAAGASADTAQAFAAITLLALLSTALFYLLHGLERMLLRWARDTST
ncbi:ABC transporter permease [Phytohabitans sp. ZYX-F-186]|uniref:ABC transporter permease n=1 Tax=Phytohabitans maris TaxID=3071409 RepID=A0ABU0ZMG7_9ACTN|nr:ABC transporter permease [Phytohabitans sp. ZYX-F-186]MDQ7907584.1 ABC transporter permease [Phytohabitans sp. ZYX-F-186]